MQSFARTGDARAEMPMLEPLTYSIAHSTGATHGLKGTIAFQLRERPIKQMKMSQRAESGVERMARPTRLVPRNRRRCEHRQSR